ncbi:tyrosine-type recombinase/integrase [Hespellia stercorisuis]|uniref:Site-specific recombinase XerD n=1 Tax=Hespellia stercorisuis DSM 15480 TaxID=1121950 RepID=A0A1M6N2E8_9FIRM|nr:tyrosine-type recombinase/integrase [Hespellia stercorisuis]SHJ89828.1 Site-specific recombinase XerD [Hespellia stercorisuis DSM 15480]
MGNNSSDKIKTYQEQLYIDNTVRLREIIATLPSFSKDFFRAIEPTTSAKTRISYAYDIRVFFRFLLDNNPYYKNKAMDDFTVKDLERLESVDIEEYMEFLKVYRSDDNQMLTNGEKGLSRKMSALRSFYAYYYKRQIIEKNPTLLVDMPKLHEKAIIRLDTDEVALLLDFVENCGDQLTGQAKVYYEKTKYRDLAILTLLLGTGIRVSECVGLDVLDVDFKNNGIKVTRKGGNEMVVYFGEEVRGAIQRYLDNTRNLMRPLPGHENALFLSTQKKRMGVQAVENMVKKYARQVTPNKKITPHKLRSTYGTALYKETGDIYLVADVLGHKDVNTTKKHYAAIDENRRKQAASAVKLRES